MKTFLTFHAFVKEKFSCKPEKLQNKSLNLFFSHIFSNKQQQMMHAHILTVLPT